MHCSSQVGLATLPKSSFFHDQQRRRQCHRPLMHETSAVPELFRDLKHEQSHALPRSGRSLKIPVHHIILIKKPCKSLKGLLHCCVNTAEQVPKRLTTRPIESCIKNWKCTTDTIDKGMTRAASLKSYILGRTCLGFGDKL